MEHRDLKRFITGFLVLATVTGSLTLVFSNFYGQSAPEVAKTEDAASASAPKIGDKALTETLPTSEDSLAYDITQPYTPSANPNDNFTDNLVQGIAYNIVKANPTGPDVTAGLTVPPDINAVVDDYVQNVALTPLLYPIDESRIATQKKYSSDDLSAYLAGIDKIFSETSGASGLGRLAQGTASSTPDPDALAASNFVFAKAQEDLYALSVPAPMLDLHKSLLGYAELYKELSGVDYVNDPVKALAYAGKFPTLAAAQQQKIGTELDKMQRELPKTITEANDHLTPAQAARMALGIQEAHAFIFHDIIHTITSVFNGTGIWAQEGLTLTEWLHKLATQILKNQIVHKLVQQTIRWAQGGGKPQFVTNWKQFLGDAASNAAATALSQIEPRLCSGFRPYVTTFLRNANPQGNDYSRLNCTLNQIVNNVRGSYVDFSNGGWTRFGQLSQPQNNAWGAIALGVETQAQQAQQAQSSAQHEAETGSGFLATKSCVKYDIKTVPKAQAQNQPNFVGIVRCFTENRPPNPNECDPTRSSTCGDQTTVELCEVKICQPGGEQITTPGDAAAETINKAIGADLDNIISAEDLTGLVSVLINSAMNRLINIGKKGLLGLFSSSDNPPADGSGLGGGTGNDANTTPDDPQEVETQRQQVLQLLSNYTQRLDQSSSTLAAWDALVSETKGSLSSAGASCSNRTVEAQERSDTIDGLAAHVQADLDQLEELTTTLAAIKQKIVAATSFDDLSKATDDLNATNNDISELATRVILRSGQLNQVNEEAQANVQDHACSTPLSSIDDQ